MNVSEKRKQGSDKLATQESDFADWIAAETVGQTKGMISVEIGARFLEHFSEQLYSSPQKAFEELISNGWDAGATVVDVHIPDNLKAENATLTVFDNGESMDEAGLQDLWTIAFSPKAKQTEMYGRRVVGKFGIGKLATYVLASRLTYICKAADGVIRRVTMNYDNVDKDKPADKQLVSEMKLNIYELTVDELEKALTSLDNGSNIKGYINGNPIPPIGNKSAPDEFGAPTSKFSPPKSNSWTLAILSGLRPAGRELQAGRLRRMLEAALPMSSELSIRFNGETLASSKLEYEPIKVWKIGEDLEIPSFITPGDKEGETEEITLSFGKKKIDGVEYSYADIPGIGPVSGTIALYEEIISGGKSEELGHSNGYLINVLGRVVNKDDPAFKAENHSHAVWSRFRMAIRADGLNPHLITNREQFKESK